jgi:hypothetical protein
MANKIQIKRGNIADIPILDSGEFGFTIDTEEVYIGTGSSNIQILTSDDIYTNSNVDSHLSGSNGINYSEGVISPTYGSASNTICQGNDSRLLDARTPTSHDNTYHSTNYEEDLGTPSTDDQILASKTDGSRFWTPQTGISGVNTVEKPSITSPENLTTDLTQTPDIVLSAYYALYNKPQQAIQVQISDTSGDYSTPTFDSTVGDTEDTISVSPALDEDTTYYCRGRYQNVHDEWSSWSEEIQFTVGDFYVEKPTNIYPEDEETEVDLEPELESDDFSVSLGSDTLDEREYEITKVSDSSVVYNVTV